MKYSLIVQARLGSTRFPGKIMQPFLGNKTILDLLLLKLKSLSNNIIVATSEDIMNDPLVSVCNRHKVLCYRGSENNVLERFLQAAKMSGADGVFRVCSDNPFIDIEDLKRLYQFSLEYSNIDYISFLVDGKPSIKTHYGFWCEYVSVSALKKVSEMTSDMLYQEHVTNFIYEHPEMFNIKWLKPSFIPLKNIRLTVDTKDDFMISKAIYNELVSEENTMFPSTSSVFSYLEEHPELVESMNKQIKLNSK